MKQLENYSYIAVLAVIFIFVYAFRPLLPVDETRYMTVAWEMFLSKNYNLLSVNFEPYHHKPPLLFWLINICWNIFGVSRWSAMIPLLLAASSVLVLTKILAEKLFPEQKQIGTLVPWIILGSVPFLAYSTLVMFDLMVTAAVLWTLCVFLDYARHPKFLKLVLAGLCLGIGALIKGPVIYLYLLWPLFLYSFWRKPEDKIDTGQFFLAVFVAILISFLPLSFWLVPTLLQSGNNFAYWLLWEQTAGRIKGDFNASHARPLLFYFLVLPVMFLPWILHPKLCGNLKNVNFQSKEMRFLLSATIPVFISFSLIAGKQPHYLLPLMPFICIGMAVMFARAQVSFVKRVSLVMVALFILAHIIGSFTLLKNYDLKKYADFYKDHRQNDYAFVRNYQGELGFLAQIRKPVDNIPIEQLKDWFNKHPNGYAIIRYSPKNDLSMYHKILSQPYRGKYLGIFELTSAQNTTN